jgi:DNA-binding transcriptional LysR family regulator
MMNDVDLAAVDLNLLVVFEAVYDARHVGSAARRLHVSSSAVSHGLRRLRELLGDPLFVKAPKGVVPSARAAELAAPIAEILTRVRGVMRSVKPFDPKTSARRFTIATSDATMSVLLPGLVAELRREAPYVDLGFRSLLPPSGLDDLDSGAIDLAVLPIDDVPARFFERVVYEDEFVIAARAGHPFLRKPSLRRYCDELHVLVSSTGQLTGFLDQELGARGLSRRVAFSVPGFMLALAALSKTDLLAAVPRSLVRMHAARFGVASVKAPLPLRRWQQRGITVNAAMADPSIAWLFTCVERAGKLTMGR